MGGAGGGGRVHYSLAGFGRALRPRDHAAAPHNAYRGRRRHGGHCPGPPSWPSLPVSPDMCRAYATFRRASFPYLPPAGRDIAA